MKLEDFKIKEQDTRLLLFGSTVFKLKYKTSHELREAMGVQSQAEAIQKDLKMVTAAVLSQALSHTTLSPIRTDNIIVFTGSCPWTVCSSLYFAHNNQPLSVYPCIILMLVSVLPPSSQQKKHARSKLGKHRKEKAEESLLICPVDDNDEPTQHKKQRIDPNPEESVYVPSPSAACLPTGAVEGGRVAPERDQVMAAAEQSKERLHALSQPCWEGTEVAVREDTKGGRSLFQCVKRFLGWM